jgi:V/A-type H+-transporting ATPase subunit D
VPNQIPSRGAVLELRDERHAMSEGHRFLDEKCLVLAAEMLKQAALHRERRKAVEQASAQAAAALASAIARHGLESLACLPAADATHTKLEVARRGVMGVPVIETRLAGSAGPPPSPVLASPEARECAAAFARFATEGAALAGYAGNLERLGEEYRKSIRRARALSDVLLPGIDRELAEMEAQLEDLEREDAINMRLGARPQ